MSDAPERPAPAGTRAGPERTGGSALLVAIGIFCSRVTGLVRQRVFAHYFGLGPEADAFLAAFRIPNFLQNLFGEGALSGSFIPVTPAAGTGGTRIGSRAHAPSRARRQRHRPAGCSPRRTDRPDRTDSLARRASSPFRSCVCVHRLPFPPPRLRVLNSHQLFLISYTALAV